MGTDVTELPEEQLKKSVTWRKYVEADGMCLKCKEHTSLLDPCCGVSVYFQGGEYYYADLWDEIDDELKKIAEPDFDSKTKEDI